MMRLRSVTVMWLAWAAVGCAPQAYRVELAPSLRPVDAARPMVVFSQIQGKACGRDAVLGAVRDMKRLRGVDGFLEVVVEDTGEGDERCAKVTAYPFRYGSSLETPELSQAGEPLTPLVVPGRAADGGAPAAPAAPAATAASAACLESCSRLAARIEQGPSARALAGVRCEQRCEQPEPAFAACVRGATDATSVAACLALPAALTEVRP